MSQVACIPVACVNEAFMLPFDNLAVQGLQEASSMLRSLKSVGRKWLLLPLQVPQCSCNIVLVHVNL